MTSRADDINKTGLREALTQKAEERGTTIYVDNHEKYLADIRESRDLLALWNAYKQKYPYAKDIDFNEIVDCLTGVFGE